MSLAEKKVRFGIGQDQVYSEVWTLLVRKSDVYLMSRSMRGWIKLSAHASGVCQLAFNEPYVGEVLAKPGSPFSDRSIRRWKRASTPPRGPLHLTSVYFSAFEKWDPLEPFDPRKPAVWLPPPEHGSAVEVAIFLSWDDPVNHCAPFQPEDTILAHFRLESGEFVTLLPRLVPLPPDYFDFQKVPWFLGVGGESEDDWDDARGISSISLVPREDGGIDFHSRHNMRLVTVPGDFELAALNPR